MSVRNKLITAGAALAVSALALAGCSSSEASSPASSNDSAGEQSGSFASGDSGVLILGVVPDNESTQNNWEPLSQYIGIITGKEVRFFEAADYTALIEAAIAGNVDVAALSGFTYYNAWKNGADLTPFGAMVTGELTEPGYYSVAFANKDSGITSLAGFAGNNICFVTETSTSGRLFPSKALKEAGIDPSTGVTPVYAGKHDASLEKVIAGTECVAGFAEDAIADTAISAGEVVEVDRQLVPGAPIVYQNALPEDLRTTLVDKLADVTLEEMIAAGVDVPDADAARAWMTAIVPIDDAYYDQIRDLCTELPEVEACQ